MTEELICIDEPCPGCTVCHGREHYDPRWTGQSDHPHRDRVILEYSRRLIRLYAILSYLELQTSYSYGKSHSVARKVYRRLSENNALLHSLRWRAEELLGLFVKDPPCDIMNVFYGSVKVHTPGLKGFERPLPKVLPPEAMQMLAKAIETAESLPTHTRLFVEVVSQGHPDQEMFRDFCSKVDTVSQDVLRCIRPLSIEQTSRSRFPTFAHVSI